MRNSNLPELCIKYIKAKLLYNTETIKFLPFSAFIYLSPLFPTPCLSVIFIFKGLANPTTPFPNTPQKEWVPDGIYILCNWHHISL